MDLTFPVTRYTHELRIVYSLDINRLGGVIGSLLQINFRFADMNCSSITQNYIILLGNMVISFRFEVLHVDHFYLYDQNKT